MQKLSYPIVLASSSPFRSELLKRIVDTFIVDAPTTDEDSFRQKWKSPIELAQNLAKLKAQEVFIRHPEKLIIASDQVAALGERILGKPLERHKAIEQLTMLSGRTHQIITAVHLIWPLGCETICDVSHLTMNAITVKEIENYVDLECPFNCAGSYQIEKMGIRLFSQVDSRDFNAIVGLPIIALNQLLKKIQKE